MARGETGAVMGMPEEIREEGGGLMSVRFEDSNGIVIKYPNKMRVGRAKRTVAQTEKDREEIGQMWLSGKNHYEIAAELNKREGAEYQYTSGMVGKDVQWLLNRWLARQNQSANVWIGQELARIDRLEQKYWAAWDRSQEDVLEREEIRVEDNVERGVDEDGEEIDIGVEGGGPRVGPRNKTLRNQKREEDRANGVRQGKSRYNRSKVTETVKQSLGDVRFLEGVERCIVLRMRLLNLGNEKKSTVNINWREEAKASGVNPDQVIDSILLAMDGRASEGGDA